ncbi:MAG TPA: efflux RND transporter permease subunit [bacterium]|nr:efflux RND transporter permease subunit [bacterium]
MNLPKLAIERPVFISCVVILIMVLGLMAYSSLGVENFPDVSFPYIFVTTPYQGASPEEIETQISKPLEDELSTLQGVKKVSSINSEGFSSIFIQFTLETDAKDAEQRVRDRVSFVRPTLPKGVDEPVIQRYDPTGAAVALLSLTSSLSPADAFDLADQVIKPQLAQVPGVGVVNIQGGRKKEIRVELDRNQLNRYRISASQVADRIALNGTNIPVGKVSIEARDLLFRSVGQYDNLDRLRKTSVNFVGSDVSIPVERLGQVTESLEEPIGYTYVNGTPTLILEVFKQSKANTVSVVDAVNKRLEALNADLKTRPGSPALTSIRDAAKPVRLNLDDVKRTILQGIFLTVLVVFLFLGSFRSTLITVTSLPVSLLGAFILMNAENFTLNVMTLLALSLSVGLLIDDAIVVRENIWRHIEEGEEPKKAAVDGTLEVALAVVATSSVIIAVFFPIAFLHGTVGQFFKQFGLSVCFAMGISLFEAMVMGPMLSAYWARKKGSGGFFDKVDDFLAPILTRFNRLQNFLEDRYAVLIDWCLRHRLWVVLGSIVLFFLSVGGLGPHIKSTFLPSADIGEFMTFYKAPPGTSLESMRDQVLKMDEIIRKHPEVALTSMTIGGMDSTGTARQDPNTGRIYVRLKPYTQRKNTTSDLKDMVRKELEPYKAQLKPQVADFSEFGDWAPFNLNLIGEDYAVLAPFAEQVVQKIKGIKGIADVQSTYDGGKPEFQAVLDPEKMKVLGVSGVEAGMDLRTQVEGATPAKFRQKGLEYDIRVRLKEDQRNIEKDFYSILVPNQNHNMVRLSDIAQPVTTEGPAKINRQNRARYVQISGQLGPGGALGNILNDAKAIMDSIQKPQGITYEFVGQAEDYADLGRSMVKAVFLAILFTFMILASLYESPILPFTIMMAIPLSIVGAFFALFVTGQSLNIFSMISLVMLLGLVTKNSILLVDYTLQMIRKGMSREEALKHAGRVRLRPILMTTFALIAGMLPLALALTEVGKFRQSMGVAVEGGLISSLILTLIIVPSVFGYFDDFRLWLRRKFKMDADKGEPARSDVEKPKVRLPKPKARKETGKLPETPVQNPEIMN